MYFYLPGVGSSRWWFLILYITFHIIHRKYMHACWYRHFDVLCIMIYITCQEFAFPSIAWLFFYYYTPPTSKYHYLEYQNTPEVITGRNSEKKDKGENQTARTILAPGTLLIPIQWYINTCKSNKRKKSNDSTMYGVSRKNKKKFSLV